MATITPKKIDFKFPNSNFYNTGNTGNKNLTNSDGTSKYNVTYYGFQNTNDIIGNVDLSTMTVDELKEKYDDVINVLRSPYSYTNVNLFELESFLSNIEEEFAAREITLINADNIDVIINQLSTDIGTYNRSGNIRMVKQLEDEKKAYEALSDFISKNGKLYTSFEEAVKDFSLDVENECYTKSYDIFVPDNYDNDKLEGLYYLINKYPGLCDNPVIQLNASKYMCDRTASYIYDEFKNKRKDLVFKCLKFNSDGSIDMENTDFVTLSFLRLENVDILDCLEEIFGDSMQSEQIYAGIDKVFLPNNPHYSKITREQYEHYLELYNNNPSEGLAYFYSLKDVPKESANDYNYKDGFETFLLDYYFDYEFPEEEHDNAVYMSQFLYQHLFAYENAINFELINSDDFSEYVNDDLIIEISKDYKKYENIDDDSLNYDKIAYYMTEEERKVYFYRKNKYGDKNANEYLTFLKMELRDRAGKEKALETLESFRVDKKKERFDRIKDIYPEGFDPYEGEDIYDENGNPIYDFTGLDEQALLALIGCEDGVATWWDGLENAFAADGEMSCFDYEKYYIIQMLNGNLEGYTVKNYEHFKTFTYEASLSIGNMLPTMAVSLAAQAASGGIPVWALSTISFANQGLFALSIYGNNKEQLLQSGLEHDAKLEFRAMLGALSEVALERYLGAIPGISKLDDSANILCRMLKEGTEESTQVIVDALFDTVIYGEEFSVDLEELAKSGLLGAVTGGVLNVPICVTINGVKTQFGSEVITDIYNVTDSDLIDMFYMSALSKSLAAYSVGNYADAVKIMQELINKNPQLYTNKVNEVCNNILNKNGIISNDVTSVNNISNNNSIETLEESVKNDKTQTDVIKQDNNISQSEKNIQMIDSDTENAKNVSVTGDETAAEIVEKIIIQTAENVSKTAGKVASESVVAVEFNELNTLISDISSNKVDINSLNLTQEKVNSLFEIEGITIEQKYIMQKKFMDAVSLILQNGGFINQTTFKAIFDSNIFSADSSFAKDYLYDTLIDLGAPELAAEVRNIYEQARLSTINENTRVNMKDLYSFCDHTESHVLQVAFLTMTSLNAINNTISSGNNGNGKYAQYLDYKTVFIAGLMHDLGMGAGMVNENGDFVNPSISSYLKNADGVPILISEFIENNVGLANVVRPNHTLNSALSILKNRSYFEQIDINPELLALLCFSHSKSNSGVSDLTSPADWAFSIEKISNAVELYNSKYPDNKIIFDINVFGKLTDEKVETSKQKVAGAKKRVTYETNKIEFKESLVEQLASLGLALRVGDAYVNKAKVFLPSNETLSWKYKGKTYSTNMLVLTQTGAFMAYDPNATYYNNHISNDSGTESSNYGAFIYFKKDENGNYVPWSADPSVKFEKKDGIFIIDDSNSSCLMNSSEEIKDSFILMDGSKESLLVLDNGYYKKVDGDKVSYYEVITHNDGEFKGKSELIEITSADLIYSYVILGNTITPTSGQFLAGESNVSYACFNENGELVSKYYVRDIELFPFNTIEKGIVERVGEIATAPGIYSAVDIVFNESQFDKYFDVVDGCVVAKTTKSGINYGQIFINEINLLNNKDNMYINFTINGYSTQKINFNNSEEIVGSDNNSKVIEDSIEMPKLKNDSAIENTEIEVFTENDSSNSKSSNQYFKPAGDLSDVKNNYIVLNGKNILSQDITSYLKGDISDGDLSIKYQISNLDIAFLVRKVLIQGIGDIEISPKVLSEIEFSFKNSLTYGSSFSYDDTYIEFAEKMAPSDFSKFTWFKRSDGTSFGLQDNGKVVFKNGNSVNSYIYSNGDVKHVIYSELDLINEIKDNSKTSNISDILLNEERILNCFRVSFGYIGSISSNSGNIIENIECKLNIMREKTLCGELRDFFEVQGITDYGQAQGAIEKLLTYSYRFKKMDYRTAKELVNKAKAAGKAIPHIRKITTSEYLYLQNKLIQMGFSEVDSTIILNTINDAGACSYASVCNEIFYMFRNAPLKFEEIFGYPLYKNINGVRKLNTTDLLLDLYLYCNDVKNGGYLIENGKINPAYLSTQIDPLGNILPNAANYQVFLSSGVGRNINMINSFLKSKDSSLSFSSNVEFNNLNKSNISEQDFLALVDRLRLLINSGNTVSLGFYYEPKNNDKIINMMSFDNTKYGNVSTATWNEGGGHSVTITEVYPHGLIVSSWGNKYLISKDDLINGGRFVISSSKITGIESQI